ncbi:hypothetical protein [Adhaeribacter aquaticus]|uniref:hypothetical protein n=1 Tax=Adhaeribacter aquaticus TaxID=299567 RepID=UPI000412555C|nr:hypothetical protein [Adhaeribacter aquaticus]
MPEKLITPVLFLIFNRPENTQLVFNEIRKAAPEKLFIAADGPRASRPGETEKCELTRRVIDQIDWPCEVFTLIRDQNLGCRVAVSSAIDWFFENVEEGIILEDDCLPDQSFFWFCQELLEKYRNDSRIMHITGSNHQYGRKRGDASYYFSRIPHVWGWATWRRAWDLYDVNMASFPEFVRSNKIADVFKGEKVQKEWIKVMYRIYNGHNTWDYQWSYTNFIHNSLCIIPNVNLISNIGFGIDSTHPTDPTDKLANTPTESINEIIHPTEFVADMDADYFSNTEVFNPPSISTRIKNRLRRAVYQIKLYARHK